MVRYKMLFKALEIGASGIAMAVDAHGYIVCRN